jgi:calcineurin-like phosphoesterase family protein
MIYITSDTHFGHRKIIDYEQRPFTSADMMDRVMIDNWNDVVCDGDTVIHLGDFSLLPPEETIEICQELKGHIILINGNHDHRTKTFWEDRAGILKWFKRPQYLDGIWLTHRVDWRFLVTEDYIDPFKIWTGKFTYSVIKDEDTVLHGHSHGQIAKQGQFINCGVDAWNFTPVALSFILPRAVNKIQEWVDTNFASLTAKDARLNREERRAANRKLC